MSGAPTETEVRAQWVAAIDILETARAHADTAQAGASGTFDTLLQALEGEYTPTSLSSTVDRIRGLYSAIVDPGTALEIMTPVLFEYANILSADASDGFGASSNDVRALFLALYDWFIDNSITIETRAITYDTTPTAGGANVGNGTLSRLTEDENGFDLEACTVEKKQLKCTRDVNSGAQENAETFLMVGSASSRDALLRGSFGSAAEVQIRNHHSGTGAGGSLLTNSSFSDFGSGDTPKFSGWTEDSNGGQLAQDTTNFYESHPGSQIDASLRINGGGGDVKISQGVDAMRVRRLDPDRPYFFRVMLNPTIGTASGGTVTIRLGSTSASATIASLSSGWNELALAFDSTAWFTSFNEDDLDVEIEWASSSSGYLLVDCAILAPWDFFDGTYWFLRQSAGTPTPWLVNDILTVTDTGGAPGTGILQYWLWVAGLGYLPSSGTPTISDP